MYLYDWGNCEDVEIHENMFVKKLKSTCKRNDYYFDTFSW